MYLLCDEAEKHGLKAEDFAPDAIKRCGLYQGQNLVKKGGAEPKIDIRDWSPDHSKMGKGISLTADEIEKLKELI